MLKRLKFLQSTTFRLTLLFAAFFCASVIALLIFVYFATVREMESQIKHRITAQINEAISIYHLQGIAGLKKRLGEFLEEEEEGLSIYLLTDGQGHTLAGNMESWPEDIVYAESWMFFDIDSKNTNEEVHVLAHDTVLNGGYRLLVGYSLRGPDRAKHVLLDVVSASVALTFLVTALGSAFFSNVIRRRLERVNQICAQVINGNLDVTMPVTGGGDEFDHLAANVNTMLDRIAKLVRGLKQTSDNIAHDLRTPLNRHRHRLETLLAQRRAGSQEALKAGIEEIDMIVETLNSILRISQAQSGVASGHFVTFDLAAAVIDVVEFYGELAEQKSIVIQYDIIPVLMVSGDKPLLTQAIANLIDNAIKYTPAGGAIDVKLTHHHDEVECVVADNGPGIPVEYYDKVKERFFRLEASRTSAGTGLGLSLADAVAQLHRGELAFADNTPGLRATLKLPILPKENQILPLATVTMK